MQKVEAAVGEADRLAGAVSPCRFGVQAIAVKDLGAFGCVVIDQVAVDLVAGQERHAELLDLEAAGDVAERGGFGIIGAAGQAEADDGEDHVAGAGDVVDLPGRVGRTSARPSARTSAMPSRSRVTRTASISRLSTSFWPTRIASSALLIVIPVASWASSRFGVMQCTPR